MTVTTQPTPQHHNASVASIMRPVKIDRHTNSPDLHEQVAAELRRAIGDGEATPGERLPPAKTSPPSSA